MSGGGVLERLQAARKQPVRDRDPVARPATLEALNGLFQQEAR